MTVSDGHDIDHAIELTDSDDDSDIYEYDNNSISAPAVKQEPEAKEINVNVVPNSDPNSSLEELAQISGVSAAEQSALVQDFQTQVPLKAEDLASTTTDPCSSSAKLSIGPNESPLFFSDPKAPGNTEINTFVPPLPELPLSDLPDDDFDIYSTTRSRAAAGSMGELEVLMLYNEGQITITEENAVQPTGADTMAWGDDLQDHAGDAVNFDTLKQEYLHKRATGAITDVEEIKFIKAGNAENRRLKELEHSLREVPEIMTPPQPPLGSVDSGFYGPAIPSPPMSPLPPTLPSKSQSKTGSKSRNYVNARETRDAIAIGTAPKVPKRKASAINGVKKSQKRAPRAVALKHGRKPNLSNLDSLGRSDIIRQAQANASAPNMPRSSARDKATALQELVASIPSADQQQAKSDSRALLDATKKFRGHGAVRSDGQGGWLLKNMKSSLYNHQLLGAAFLRDRENDQQKPQGGMVCDEMGFGKTVQMM